MCIVQSHIAVRTKMPAYFIATAHSMIIDMLDSRGVFGSANNATCILRRGFCTSVLFIVQLLAADNASYVHMYCTLVEVDQLSCRQSVYGFPTVSMFHL